MCGPGPEPKSADERFFSAEDAHEESLRMLEVQDGAPLYSYGRRGETRQGGFLDRRDTA